MCFCNKISSLTFSTTTRFFCYNLLPISYFKNRWLTVLMNKEENTSSAHFKLLSTRIQEFFMFTDKVVKILFEDAVFMLNSAFLFPNRSDLTGERISNYLKKESVVKVFNFCIIMFFLPKKYL